MAAMLVAYRGIRPVTTVILRLETPTGSLPGRERSWRPGAPCGSRLGATREDCLSLQYRSRGRVDGGNAVRSRVRQHLAFSSGWPAHSARMARCTGRPASVRVAARPATSMAESPISFDRGSMPTCAPEPAPGTPAHRGRSGWGCGSDSRLYLAVWAWCRSNPAPMVESRTRYTAAFAAMKRVEPSSPQATFPTFPPKSNQPSRVASGAKTYTPPGPTPKMLPRRIHLHAVGSAVAARECGRPIEEDSARAERAIRLHRKSHPHEALDVGIRDVEGALVR